MSNSAIIVAAGKSERFGDKVPKQFHQIAGRPLLAWTIEAFEKAEKISKIVVVVSKDYLAQVTKTVIDPYNFMKVDKVVMGGKNRAESVMNGLKALPDSTEIVAIHDGVRPLVQSEDINKVLELAQKDRAAILATQSKDTVKEVGGVDIKKTLIRSNIWLAQTPQAFDYKLILEAHRKSANSNSITDDAQLVEQMGIDVKVIEPSACNLKVTTPEDLLMVKSILEQRANG